MKYSLSMNDDLGLKIDCIKRNLESYLIVKKRKTFLDSQIEESFDLYELEPEELNSLMDLENESLQSFSEKYEMQPLGDNEEVISIYLYNGLDVVQSIGKPILVYVFEAGKPGYVKEISDTREALQKIVEGELEYVSVGREDLVLVCNETSMLDNLPKNRGLHGTFLIKGTENGYSASLTDKQIQEIRNEFDKKEHNNSKSKYLKEYFDTHEIPRKLFTYKVGDTMFYYGSEVIIDFLLQQEDERKIEMIESEIKNIEKHNKDIYKYLESVGLSLARQRVR